jgi:hypothetical protein
MSERPTSIRLDIPDDPAERVRQQDEWRRRQRAFGGLPRACGVSRMADNDKAVLISFERPLTDDELRQFHDALSHD